MGGVRGILEAGCGKVRRPFLTWLGGYVFCMLNWSNRQEPVFMSGGACRDNHLAVYTREQSLNIL